MATVGIFSASMVNFAGDMTKATAQKWPFVQIFLARSYFSAQPEKNGATPQLRRYILSVSPTLVCSRLPSELRRREARRRSSRNAPSIDFFADVGFSAQDVESGGAETQETLPKRRPPSISEPPHI